MINLIGLSSSGGSGGGTSIGNGAASTNGSGLNLSPTQVTVSYQGKTMTLQAFVNALAEEIITKRLNAEWVWIDNGLSASIVRARGTLYIGSGPGETNVNS